MTDQIPKGCFLFSRLIFSSAIWMKHPMFLRLFFWLIGKANFQDGYTFKGHVLQRGQLIITYGEIADALAYRYNRVTIKPSQKEIRIMIAWLESEGMILVKPLIDGTKPNQGTPPALTRAYIGLLITVVNYDTYQDMENYRGRGIQGTETELGQIRKENRKEEDLMSSVKEIIDFLNTQSGKNFRPTTKPTITRIKARLGEGWTVDDFFTVIEVKCGQWKGDPKMCAYLRPDTLFGSKFESYLNEKPTPRASGW